MTASIRTGSRVAALGDATPLVATVDIVDHRTRATHVFIDGVPQSLETRHTRLHEPFGGRP
jgi:hypothetical protein